jgi:YegS/Rv2252/BmrU family lipid kinase
MSSSVRAIAVINPLAARGRGRRAWPQIKAELLRSGLPCDEVITQSGEDGMARVQRAGADGYTTVISVGGDGTTHWAVNGLMRSLTTPAPALAVIPEGTANDFARCLGIPLKASLAARVLANGVRRRVDVGQMNDRYYATISGVGFDAEVAQRVNQWPRWIRGTTVYVAGILQQLLLYTAADTTITIDGHTQTLKMFLLAAANTNCYGGGMLMAPHAKIDDGLLAVVYASDLTKLETLAVLPRVFSGRHLEHPKVSHTLAREVRVDSKTPLAIHADGESLGTVPAVFRIIPQAIEVVVPRREDPLPATTMAAARSRNGRAVLLGRK